MKERAFFGFIVNLAIVSASSLPCLAQITITVPATANCVDSKINVSSGESIQFSSVGQASYGYEGEPINSTPSTNPDGDRFVNGINLGKKNDPNAIYKGFIGALIGKIGTNGNYFFIGAENLLSMGQSGRLFLCYNDVDGQFNNNKGSYRVSIYRRSSSPDQQTNRTATPQVPTWRQFVDRGGGRFIKSDYDLPDEFKNGFVYFNQGASVINAYILKSGLSSYPAALKDGPNQIDFDLAKRYVNSGQAIYIYWNLGNSALRYANDTEVRFPNSGQGCFRATCLTAPFLSQTEISRILRSARRIGEPPVASSGNQRPPSQPQTGTTTTRPVRQTFKDVKSLGMAQFLQGNQELIAAQKVLQRAAQNQYPEIAIVPNEDNDFMTKPFTTVAKVEGAAFGKRVDIGYADYLKLKLKLKAQINAFNNALATMEKIEQFNNKLKNDNRQGGTEVSKKIVANFQTYWSRVAQQNQQPSLSLGRMGQALAYALEETRRANITFAERSLQTGGKLASAFTDVGKLVSKILVQPKSSSPDDDATTLVGRKLEYIITMKQKLQDMTKAYQAKEFEELTNINLEIANATIALIDPENDPNLVRSAQVIAISSEAKKLREMMIFLQNRELSKVLDSLDRVYLITAGVSSAIKIGTSTVTIITPSPKAGSRELADKVDAINELLFQGLKIGYEENVRREYERLMSVTNRLQERISGLNSSIDFSAQEVGQYLIRSRTDVVTRRSDGTIAVSVDGVVYPP